MRRIRTFLEILYRQFISDKKVNMVILLTCTITFFFVFIISKEIYAKFSEYGDLDEGIRTYEIRPSGKNSVQLFNSVLNEMRKRNIEKIQSINLTIKNSEIKRINISFDDGVSHLDPQNMSHIILEGRYFNINELETGVNVIILSLNDYTEYYNNYNIGDSILISGYEFRLIGISKEEDKEIGSIVPYKTILKLSEDPDHPFRVNEAFITLKERISKREIRDMIKKANSISENDHTRITTSSSWMVGSILNNISGSVIAAFIVILLCILNLIKMVNILNLRNKYKMKIYLNLGYEKKYIVMNVVAEVSIIVFISIVIGIYLSSRLAPIIKGVSFI